MPWRLIPLPPIRSQTLWLFCMVFLPTFLFEHVTFAAEEVALQAGDDAKPPSEEPAEDKSPVRGDEPTTDKSLVPNEEPADDTSPVPPVPNEEPADDTSPVPNEESADDTSPVPNEESADDTSPVPDEESAKEESFVPSDGSVEKDDIAEMSIDDLLQLDVSVWVSSKRLETTEVAPSTLTVLTRTDIQHLGLTTVEDLLNFISGYHVTTDVYQGRISRIYVRGLRSAFNTNVLFLLDGRPINDLFFGSASILNRNITVENIKQIEVIRGPGSSLYGANAFTGVVNIVTLTEGNGVDASGGEMMSKNLSMWLNQKIGDLSVSTFGYIFSDEGHKLDDVEDAFGQTDDLRDANDGHDATVTLEYKGFTLSARDMKRSVDGFLGFGGSSPINRSAWRQSSIDLDYSIDLLDDSLNLEAGARYIREKLDTLGLLFPAGYEIIPRVTTLDSDAMGGPIGVTNGFQFRLGVQYKLFESETVFTENILTGGATYDYTFVTELAQYLSHDPQNMWSSFEGIQRLSGAQSWADSDAKRHLIGVYLQDQQRLFEDLSITAGCRYDYYTDLDSSFSPRAALTYTTPFDSHVKLLYGHAFRAPNLAELYQRNNPLIIGNSNLKSESIDTFEFGYTQELRQLVGDLSIVIEATAYHNIAKSLITLGNELGSGKRPYKNGEKNTTTGLEFRLKITPIRDILISMSSSHILLSTEDSESIPVEAPRHMASAIINYRVWDLNFNLSGIYRSSSETFNPQSYYFHLNESVGWFVTDKLTLSGTVENITNVHYMGISDVVQTGVPQRGIAFRIGLRWQN